MLVKELQALCLDVRVLDEEGNDVDISGLGMDDNTPAYANIEEVERSVDSEAEKANADEDFDDEELSDEDYDSELDDDFDFDDEEYEFDESDDYDQDEEN